MNKINFTLALDLSDKKVYKAKVVLTPCKGFSPKLKERYITGFLTYSKEGVFLRAYDSMSHCILFAYCNHYPKRSVLAYKRALAKAMRLIIQQIELDGSHWWQS